MTTVKNFKMMLTQHRPDLVDNIDPENGLLNQLESRGVLTKRQSITINRLPDPFKKTEAILDALHRRPNEDVIKFIDSLNESGQSYIVQQYFCSNGSQPQQQPSDFLSLQQQQQPRDENTQEQASNSLPVENGSIETLFGLDEWKKLGICLRDVNDLPGAIDAEHTSNPAKIPVEPLTMIGFNPIERSVFLPSAHQSASEQAGRPNTIHHPEPVSSGADDISNHDRSQTVQESSQQIGQIPNTIQPIKLHDIIVRKCSLEFYNSKKEQSYPMNQKCRGLCVIINIRYASGQSERKGSEVDVEILNELFTKLGFRTEKYLDLTSNEIKSLVRRLAERPELKGDQCFVMFLMSHGTLKSVAGSHQTEVIFGTEGGEVLTSELLEPFTSSNCLALAGKPKIVFFQACRGNLYDRGRTQTDSSGLTDESDGMSHQQPVLSLKDFILGFPTQKGFRSFRNTDHGSWYINAIVRVFIENACDMDVSAMLRKVNGIVGEWLPKTHEVKMKDKGQFCSIHDNLSRPYLYLFPGIIEDH